MGTSRKLLIAALALVAGAAAIAQAGGPATPGTVDSDEPQQVARGRAADGPWVMEAAEGRSRSEDVRGDVLCIRWAYGEGEEPSGICEGDIGNGLPAGEAMRVFYDFTEDDSAAVYGFLAPHVGEVEIEGLDGSSVASSYDAPDSIGANVRFFAGFAEQGPLTVIARSRSGDELHRTSFAGLARLSVAKHGSGDGTVLAYQSDEYRGQGDTASTWITCGELCEVDLSDASVTLVAEPADGSTFTGWSGACAGADETCEIQVSRSTEVSATFESSP